MFALAIDQKPTHIGMWGVDMSATEEYGYQRAGCHYFIQKAREAGIEIVVPLESDLLAAPMYGFCQNSPMYRKLLVRKNELQGRYDNLQHKHAAMRDEMMALSGAIDDIGYMINTWV